ncbi:helix-turn-helix transcriptional regulator [Ramlibacter albus]|uniref:Helix-turn-helix transcriptional regulator n=1 Tax=Ramlibacter albus TaxID=2079448 RepID=A0A923S2R6_9BURK|nr:helix-turn-helix transcriptional regulator [Ramlibacter albus]MBC5765754.1 helix-turn-helix transcriptional regulator [Ramlibacter albus]
METMRISTEGLRGPRRAALVRDAAFELFNLEADLDGTPPAEVHADVRVQRGEAVSVVDVATSWSIVRRTPARAAAATTDHLLLYGIEQGGSSFRNERGDHYLTRAGSIVLASQAAPYTAAAAPGRDWKFRTLRIASDRLPLSGERIRRAGFQPMPEDSPMSRLAADYITSLGKHHAALPPAGLDAALQALDLLLAAALGDTAAPQHDDGAALHAARVASARAYIESALANPGLSPDWVARHIGVSARQLHRVFEREGTTVAHEIRRMRVARAQAMLAREPARAVTDIALACGFDALPTFYRCFRAVTGVTATEWRCGHVT